MTPSADTPFKKYLSEQDILYKNRVLQFLVMTDLFQITELATNCACSSVFRRYRWLYAVAKVIHRDVIIMYWKKEDSSTYGVLSDYDLSLSLIRQTLGPTSKQCTGTKSYMAIQMKDCCWSKGPVFLRTGCQQLLLQFKRISNSSSRKFIIPDYSHTMK